MTREAVTVAGEVGVWDAVLHRYGATLDAHREFLVSLLEQRLPADVYELPPPFEAPEVMPMLPAELAAVAETLQRDTDDLIRSTAALLARVSKSMPNRFRPAASSGTSSLDQRL